jgi:hypothetical protein
MQKILGLLMLGGGLAFIVSEIAPSPSEREEQLAAMTRIVARATILEPETVLAEHPGLRHPVASPAAHPVATDLSVVAANAPLAAAALPAVSIANEAAPRASVTSATNSKPSVQRQLARQIQAELKRVGCYSGRLDGSWGDRSRSAMANFIARVNASLPTNEPDVFLLSLIKGQTQTVCGPTCGSDEVISGGRCVAQTLVAEGSTTPLEAGSSSPIAYETTPVAVATRPDPLPGRMSIGGPVAAQPSVSVPVTEMATTAAELLPWQQDDPQAQPSSTMAALEPDDSTVFNQPPVPPKAVKSRKAWSPPPKPVKRRYSSTRSVQQLFMHPLGRM